MESGCVVTSDADGPYTRRSAPVGVAYHASCIVRRPLYAYDVVRIETRTRSLIIIVIVIIVIICDLAAV